MQCWFHHGGLYVETLETLTMSSRLSGTMSGQRSACQTSRLPNAKEKSCKKEIHLMSLNITFKNQFMQTKYTMHLFKSALVAEFTL